MQKLQFKKIGQKNVQLCPLCKMPQEGIVNGIEIKHNKEGQITDCDIIEDKWYSFCNCKNIFFTNWENVKSNIYDEDYNTRYNFIINELPYIRALRESFNNIPIDEGLFIELGVAHDSVLDTAKRIGFETLAVDINPYLKTKHKKVIGDIETIVKELPKANCIWAAHIFEHFHYPLKVAKDLYDKLNPGGCLYVAMPDTWCIPWDDAYLWAHWHYKEHHIMWDMDSFIDALLEMGYELHWNQRRPLRIDYEIVFRKPGILKKNDTRNKVFEEAFSKNNEVPIDLINPNDEGHDINNIDQEHKEGAEQVKKLIKDGLEILPIAVDAGGTRLDGFKRYVAFKELSYKTIPVVLGKYMGCQSGKNWVVPKKKEKSKVLHEIFYKLYDYDYIVLRKHDCMEESDYIYDIDIIAKDKGIKKLFLDNFFDFVEDPFGGYHFKSEIYDLHFHIVFDIGIEGCWVRKKETEDYWKFILDPIDELTHIILLAANRKEIKPYYKNRIEELLKTTDNNELAKRLAKNKDAREILNMFKGVQYMGQVYEVLSEKRMGSKTDLYEDRLIIELCEAIHIHYRNIRLEFSEKEFLELADAITESAEKLRKMGK